MPQPKENSPIKRDILFRVHLLYAAFVLIAALVFARLIWVQLFSSEVAYNAERLEGRIFTDEIIPARRGNILTRDGEPLATSLFRYQVEMDYGSPGFDSLRTFREQSDSLAKLLALYFRDKSAAAYAQAMQREHTRRYRRHSVIPTPGEGAADFRTPPLPADSSPPRRPSPIEQTRRTGRRPSRLVSPGMAGLFSAYEEGLHRPLAPNSLTKPAFSCRTTSRGTGQ